MVMSLNYDIRNVAGEFKTEGEQWRITEALIWGTMAIDMGEITERNAQEFTERLATSAGVYGTLLQHVVDGKLVDRPITLEEVKARIGLKTNVITTTKAQFKNRIARALRDKAAREMSSR